jgi:hypothetical protein
MHDLNLDSKENLKYGELVKLEGRSRKSIWWRMSRRNI